MLGHLSPTFQSSWMAFHGEVYKDRLLTLAASSASVEEQANSALRDGKFPDGSTPVIVEKRIWRAQVKSQYVEPEIELDPSEDLDFLYVSSGKTMLKKKTKLPPREDIIVFDPKRHLQCFNKIIQWRDCPNEHRPVIEAIIHEYWDVFDPEGALRTIRGYLFNTDAAAHQPVCCTLYVGFLLNVGDHLVTKPIYWDI